MGALQHLAFSVEVCITASAGLDRIRHRKVEVAVVDCAFGDKALALLEKIRTSPSNRTAVAFAITSSSAETARVLRAGASFALEKPLSPDSIRRTLNAAYGLMVRERRRYFRCPVCVPAVLSRGSQAEIFGKTMNISESGFGFATSTPLIPGTIATAQFTLPEPQLPISAECIVRWSNDKGEAGLAFSFMPLGVSRELQSWLAKKLEEELLAIKGEMTGY